MLNMPTIKKPNVGKIHVIRFRAVDKDIFTAIRDGKKKIETRAATVKFRDITTGDRMKMVCGQASFTKQVGKARHFRSVAALLRAYKPSQIVPGLKTAKEIVALYASFPGYPEKIAACGIMALELE